MLKLFNDLKPFIEDNYRRIHVREYAKIQKISPPTASKLLQHYHKQKLLKREDDRNYQLYYANSSSKPFIDFTCSYWQQRLDELGLLSFLQKKFLNPVVILFGSFSKAEIHPESDIDIAIFSATKTEANLEQYSSKLKREIQIFRFSNRRDAPPALLNNILNGYILIGRW